MSKKIEQLTAEAKALEQATKEANEAVAKIIATVESTKDFVVEAREKGRDNKFITYRDYCKELSPIVKRLDRMQKAFARITTEKDEATADEASAED